MSSKNRQIALTPTGTADGPSLVDLKNSVRVYANFLEARDVVMRSSAGLVVARARSFIINANISDVRHGSITTVTRT